MILRKNNANVLVFGTFDCGVHPGHLFFLKFAKEMGFTISVMLSTDANVKKLKKENPVYSYAERKKQLLELGFISNVYKEDANKNWISLKKINPDIIVLGHDQIEWRHKLEELIKKYKILCVIKNVNLSYHRDKYSSTLLRNSINSKVIKTQ